MFDQVEPHLESCDCTLIADRGLSGAPLVKLCRDRVWHYLLRICKEHTVRRKMGKSFVTWTARGAIVQKAGQQWFERVLCW